MVSRFDIRLRNLSLILIACNLVYFLFPFPPIVLRSLLVALCMYVILFRPHRFSSLEKWMLALSVVNVAYFIIALLTRRSTPSMTSVGNNLCAFLPLCLFSYLARKNVMTEKFVSFMTIVLLLSCIAYYVNYEQMRMTRFLMDEDESLTINASTVFLMLLPLLIYEKKRYLLYIELFVCVFFIVSAVKRGNIVAAVIPIGIILWQQFKNSKRNAIALFGLLIVVVVGSYYFGEFISEYEYFQQRLEDTMEGNSSHRDSIYLAAFNTWVNSNFFHLWFGNGYRAVTRSIGIPAHSDWIEILVDNGVFGIIFYIGIFVSFFSIICRTRTFPEKFVLWSAFLAWFAKSIYSMAYVENWMCLLMISIGIALNGPIKRRSLDEPN